MKQPARPMLSTPEKRAAVTECIGPVRFGRQCLHIQIAGEDVFIERTALVSVCLLPDYGQLVMAASDRTVTVTGGDLGKAHEAVIAWRMAAP